jgi:peptidoglycan/xylan/chitin deacetylase (PgdA/CDA1 family)
MKPIFYTAAKMLSVMPPRWVLPALQQVCRHRTVFPLYHTATDAHLPHIAHLYQVRTAQKFEQDIDFLLQNYTPIDLRTCIGQLQTPDVFHKKPQFLLTFDDGLKEFFEVVAPILQRKGVPAVCFLNTDFIDNKALFFRYKASIIIDVLYAPQPTQTQQIIIKKWCAAHQLSQKNIKKTLLNIPYHQANILELLAHDLDINFDEYLQKQQPYLNTAQINALIAQGFEFGAHSTDHPMYQHLTPATQLQQTQQSTEIVAQKFALEYKAFAFPFTDFGVKQAFFDAVFCAENPILDISFGCAGIKNDVCSKHIQRIAIEINEFSAQEVIYGEYLHYIAKMLVGKNTIIRR